MSNTERLTDVQVGETVVIRSLDGGKSVEDRLKALGIRVGATITVISGKRNGPVVVKHGQNQTALGNGVCRKVLVVSAIPQQT